MLFSAAPSSVHGADRGKPRLPWRKTGPSNGCGEDRLNNRQPQRHLFVDQNSRWLPAFARLILDVECQHSSSLLRHHQHPSGTHTHSLSLSRFPFFLFERERGSQGSLCQLRDRQTHRWRLAIPSLSNSLCPRPSLFHPREAGLPSLFNTQPSFKPTLAGPDNRS
ncbi:hypothetical protein FA10DRAFT_166270 [Acaromyces ingoldii]|uniref:Uncharacterized protein n=1 Tax=Acaromyces ingoldii TaxID=215250 RepID=A0A316YIA5_9BASI|nr:hypothetical protein FA10DRAFT_166270 [Acaromyces ingoldii]PWN88564.1 hypothetical protein FA10DRAFT_166270 [Acaromyces ingoldii]